MRNHEGGTTINTQGALTLEQYEYLKSAARIRRCSASVLVREMLRVICQDQMILSILDDDSQILRSRKGRPRKIDIHV